MSAGFELDLGPVDYYVRAAVATFDFTLPGEVGGTVGRDMAVAMAEGIAGNSAEGKDPDGQDWAANETRYAAYKFKRYQVNRPGELGSHMLSLTSLLGKPDVSHDEVVMEYGWGTPPQRSTARNGVDLRPSERKATDREKAVWFTDGGRRFYEFDQEIAESVVAVAAEALARHLEGLKP